MHVIHTTAVQLEIHQFTFQESMISFPQMLQHGTSNPLYPNPKERVDTRYDLTFPSPPQRVAVMFYLHRYLEVKYLKLKQMVC